MVSIQSAPPGRGRTLIGNCFCGLFELSVYVPSMEEEDAPQNYSGQAMKN